MKKIIKLFFYIFIICAIISALALIALHLYMKSYIKKPEFTTMVVNEIEKATNRKAEFQGVDYSIFPLSFILKEVSIKNKDNTANFISLKKLDIKINLFKAEITNIILDSPELNVTKLSNGTFDFFDIIKTDKTLSDNSRVQETSVTKAKTKNSEFKQKPISIPFNFNIKLIRISNAVLHYSIEDSSKNMKSFNIKGLDLDIKNISLDREIELYLKIKIGQKSLIETTIKAGPLKTLPPDVSNLNLFFDGNIKCQLSDIEAFIPEEQRKQIPITEFEIKMNGKGTLSSGFNFNLNFFTPEISAENKLNINIETGLKLDIPTQIFNELMKGNLNPEIQKQIQIIFKGKMNAHAEMVPTETLNLTCQDIEFNANKDFLKLSDLSFTHKETDLNLNININGLNPKVKSPEISIKLNGNKVVIHELLKALPSASNPIKNNSTSSDLIKDNIKGTSNTDTPTPSKEQKEPDLRSIPFLDKIILDADIEIKSIIYEKNILENFISKLHLEKGIANLNFMNFNIFEGKISDIAEINLMAYPLTYKNSFKIEKIDINKASKANLKEANYFGKLNANFSLEGAGITTSNLKNNLQSHGTTEIKDSKIISKGRFEDKIYLSLNNPLLIQTIPKLEKKIEKAKVNSEKTKETIIQNCSFNYNLVSGKAIFKELVIGTPEYTLKANGDIYPFDDKINMEAKMLFSEKTTLELTDGKDLSDRLPYENKGLIFPMTLTDKLSSLTLMPDFPFITRNIAAKKLTKELTKLISSDQKKDEGNNENKSKNDNSKAIENLIGGLLGK